MIGFGVDYSGAKIHEGTSKPGMEQPIRHWTPSIAPSGMAFYTADLFPQWKNNLFIGGLRRAGPGAARARRRQGHQGRAAAAGLRERIRDVRAGPDGALWLLTDSSNGQLLRLTPGQ